MYIRAKKWDNIRDSITSHRPKTWTIEFIVSFHARRHHVQVGIAKSGRVRLRNLHETLCQRATVCLQLRSNSTPKKQERARHRSPESNPRKKCQKQHVTRLLLHHAWRLHAQSPVPLASQKTNQKTSSSRKFSPTPRKPGVNRPRTRGSNQPCRRQRPRKRAALLRVLPPGCNKVLWNGQEVQGQVREESYAQALEVADWVGVQGYHD